MTVEEATRLNIQLALDKIKAVQQQNKERAR